MVDNLHFDNEEHALAWIFSDANDAIMLLRERELLPYKLSSVQSAILYILVNAEGPVTPARISRFFFRTPHSVSSILTRMEAKNLIKKTKNLNKKNLVRITITQKGRKVLAPTANRKAYETTFGKLSAKQRKELMEISKFLLTEAKKQIKGNIFSE